VSALALFEVELAVLADMSWCLDARQRFIDWMDGTSVDNAEEVGSLPAVEAVRGDGGHSEFRLTWNLPATGA